ncbi:MAG: hypothetical protein NC311_05855 [Muribaculaceae bacterium]|nr:hypothetical protein [Muribaculaceae bacterium]
MKLPLLCAALEEMENYHEAGDGVNCSIRCPFCGDSQSDPYPHSLSIKIDVEPGEALWYQCFRASCGAKGALKTATLQELGIGDINVITELARHNATVSRDFDKPFVVRESRDYAVVNLPVGNNLEKLKYINRRLGAKLKVDDLKAYKIQLSLLDMLRLNDIRKLSVSKPAAKNLDVYCIGFISMFSDYMICRDITPDMRTGKRYYMYRVSGKPDPNDLKIYSIPREIDLMSPKSAVINVAEGPFSILGAYLNTDLGEEKPNSVWVANCGSQYTNTIMRVCKQYGLLKVRINIWSDSEIGLDKYKKLYKDLRSRLDIRRMTVYYNDASDDFGHPKSEIKIREATIYRKDD